MRRVLGGLAHGPPDELVGAQRPASAEQWSALQSDLRDVLIYYLGDGEMNADGAVTVTSCTTSIIFCRRIDSQFLLPGRCWLPQVNCYPAAQLLRGGGGDGEATEHGNTTRA
jgi:hypothetical protein